MSIIAQEPAGVDQRINHWAMRGLDRDGDLVRRGVGGAPRPVAELGIGSGAVRDVAALDQCASAIEPACKPQQLCRQMRTMSRNSRVPTLQALGWHRIAPRFASML
jgi:hypothetical protein